MALALRGPEAARVLEAAGELPGTLFRHSDQRIELALPAGQVQAVYDKLVRAGATPAGLETRQALRAEAGLPDYSQYPGYEPDSGRPTGLELYNSGHQDYFALSVPYFVGRHNLDAARPRPQLPTFQWEEDQEHELQRTPLYEWHKAHTRKVIPFAGWEMPVWYTGVIDEHNAVRRAAGLFDVAHMGVFEISGPNATEFLDLVLTNYARWFAPGESFYGYLLDQDGKVIDDLMVYRRRDDLYLMVVNAANADKDWAWLNAVNNGEVLIDRQRPDLRVLRPAILRDLKDPACGADKRVDLALQGPASLAILQSLAGDPVLKDRLGPRAQDRPDRVPVGRPCGELRGTIRPRHRPHRLHRRGYWVRDLCPPRSGGRLLGDSPGGWAALWCEALRPCGTRLDPNRGRSATLRSRTGWSIRHVTGGCWIRLLRQAPQALLYRADGASRAGENAQAGNGPLPDERARRAYAQDTATRWSIGGAGPWVG